MREQPSKSASPDSSSESQVRYGTVTVHSSSTNQFAFSGGAGGAAGRPAQLPVMRNVKHKRCFFQDLFLFQIVFFIGYRYGNWAKTVLIRRIKKEEEYAFYE